MTMGFDDVPYLQTVWRANMAGILAISPEMYRDAQESFCSHYGIELELAEAWHVFDAEEKTDG